MLSLAILPDSIIADPLSIVARNRFFEAVRLNFLILIEDDLLSIIVELSKYSIIMFDFSSVMTLSFRYIESYKRSDLFLLSSLIAWVLPKTLTTVPIFSLACKSLKFNISENAINNKKEKKLPSMISFICLNVA